MSNTFKNHKAMKRLMTIGLMLVSAFAFTNCSEQLVSPDKEGNIVDENIENNTPLDEAVRIPYEVFVDEPNTKTMSDINDKGCFTYWVDEATAETNGLGKDAVDRVKIYTRSGSTVTNQGKYTYAGNKRFLGEIIDNSLDEANDWYCIYPYKDGTGTMVEEFTIGTSQIQATAGSIAHISGANYPMLGYLSGSSVEEAPIFTNVKHLSALVALNIINEGYKNNTDQSSKSGIVIREITLSIPSASGKDEKGNSFSQTALPIVGDFTVDVSSAEITDGQITGVTYTPCNGKTSNTVTLTLADPITIAPGESAKFYMAIRPFDASSITRNNTDPIFDVGINGSVRRVTIPVDKSSFQPGKLKTVNIPVKLSYPKAHNIIGIDKFDVTVPNTTISVDVNGESITDAFTVSPGTGQKIVLKGSLGSLINALDAGFYASAWKERPAAMTVTNLNLWVGETPIVGWKTFTDALYQVIEEDNDPLMAAAATAAVMATMQDGIPRDKGSMLDFIYLTQFIDPKTITFRGLVDNGAESSTEKILIMDEEPYYKEITEDFINNFFGKRFAFNNVTPTVQGLREIINNNYQSDAAVNTSYAMYNKIIEIATTMGENGNGVMTKSIDLPIFGEVSITVNIGNAINKVFPATEGQRYNTALNDFLKNAVIAAEVEACPYLPNEADYGTKIAPTSVSEMANKPNAESNPIVFWGLNAYQ